MHNVHAARVAMGTVRNYMATRNYGHKTWYANLSFQSLEYYDLLFVHLWSSIETTWIQNTGLNN